MKNLFKKIIEKIKSLKHTKLETAIRGTELFKFIVVLISLVITVTALLGKKPDLVTAYRSLFFLSVPVAPDFYDFLKEKNFEKLKYKFFTVCFFIISTLISCISFLFGFVFSSGEDVPCWLYKHLVLDKYIGLFLIAFVFFVVSLLVKHVFCNWKTKISINVLPDVVYEKRSNSYGSRKEVVK